MDKYALSLDEFLILIEGVTTHYDERVEGRIEQLGWVFEDMPEKVVTLNGKEIGKPLIKEFVSKALSKAMKTGVLKMHLPRNRAFIVRSGKIQLKYMKPGGTNPEIYEPIFWQELNGSRYNGDEFHAIVKNDNLVTMMLNKHEMTDEQLIKKSEEHDRKRGLPRMQYTVEQLGKEFDPNMARTDSKDWIYAIDLNGGELRLFADNAESAGVKTQGIHLKERPGKEMTFAPGRMVTRMFKTGEKKTSPVLDYSFNKQNGNLTLFFESGAGLSGKTYSMEDVAIVTPERISTADTAKMAIALGLPEDFDYDKVKNVEFSGKIKEIGMYTDKPSQRYIDTMKPVPFIRIEADDVSFNTK